MKKYIAIIFVGIMALTTFGCGGKPSRLESGFGGDGEPMSSYFVAIKSDRTEFDIEDVSMTFFYGSMFKNGHQPKLEEGERFKLIVSVAADGKFREEIESFTAEEFYTEKYQVKITDIRKPFHNVFKVEYPYSKTIKIPANFFSLGSGVFGLDILEYRFYEDGRDPKRGGGGGINLLYTVVGNKVKIKCQ